MYYSIVCVAADEAALLNEEANKAEDMKLKAVTQTCVARADPIPCELSLVLGLSPSLAIFTLRRHRQHREPRCYAPLVTITAFCITI
jgi:hypothetical protein